jgi:pyroglutamyl-peptidase
MKTLLTGFLPFLGGKSNPSQQLVESISSSSSIDKMVLPVSFERCFHSLHNKLESENYDQIILMGLAQTRNKISLERFAINWMEAEYPDEDGVTKSGVPIYENKTHLHKTNLPIEKYLEQLRSLEIPSEISLSAGGYICNCVYYKTLDYLSSQKKPLNAIFIHLPPVETSLEGRVYSIEDYSRALKSIL